MAGVPENGVVRSKAISGLASGIPIRVGGQLISLLTFAITARLLSPRDFGIYGVTLLIGSFLVTIAESVLSNGLVQKDLIDERHLESLNAMCLFSGLLSVLLCVLAAPLVERFFGYSELGVYVGLISLALPFKFMASVRFALLQRELAFKKIQLANFLGIVLSLVVTVFFAELGFKVYSLIFGFIALAIGEFTMALIFERKRIGLKYHSREASEILSFAKPYLLSQICNFVAIQGYSIVIGRFGGASMLGVFTRVYTLLMVPVNLAGGVGSKIVFASAARLQNDHSSLKKVIEISVEVCTLLFIPVSIALALSSGLVTEIVLGSRWESAKAPLAILFTILFARLGYIIPESVLVGLGRVHSSARRQLFYALSTLGLSWLGLHYYGLIGASIGVAAAIFLFYVSSLTALNDILSHGIGYYVNLHLKGAAISLPAVIGYVLVRRVAPTGPVFEAVALAGYGVLLLATYLVIPADKLAAIGNLKLYMLRMMKREIA